MGKSRLKNRTVSSIGFTLMIDIGAPGVNRTPDKRFRKPLLYPTELRGRERFIVTSR